MGDTVSVKIDGGEELLRKLKQVGLDVEQSLEVIAHVGAQVFVDAANQHAPEPLISAETAKKSKKRVSVDVGYPKEKWKWVFFEKGVQPHEIKGNPQLAFSDDGEDVVTGRVNHPGMAARPFLRPAFDTSEDEAVSAVGEQVVKIVVK